MDTKFKHNNYCDCFECASPDAPFIGDNADVLLAINDYLGFGIKAGDIIQVTKVINLYSPSGGTGKTIVPPKSYKVDHVTPTFIYLAGEVDSRGNLTDTYKGYYMYANPNTYVVLPSVLVKTVTGLNTARDTVNEIGVSISDKLNELLGGFKWLIIGAIVLLVVLLILRFK